MIVIDASLAFEVILRRTNVSQVTDILASTNRPVYAPELIDLEVFHALRKQINLKRISQEIANRAIKLQIDLPVIRRSHTELLHRIWQLRDNFTPYDAAYIALAEMFGAELWTYDTKFTTATIHTAKIKLFSPAP